MIIVEFFFKKKKNLKIGWIGLKFNTNKLNKKFMCLRFNILLKFLKELIYIYKF